MTESNHLIFCLAGEVRGWERDVTKVLPQGGIVCGLKMEKIVGRISLIRRAFFFTKCYHFCCSLLWSLYNVRAVDDGAVSPDQHEFTECKRVWQLKLTITNKKSYSLFYQQRRPAFEIFGFLLYYHSR